VRAGLEGGRGRRGDDGAGEVKARDEDVVVGDEIWEVFGPEELAGAGGSSEDFDEVFVGVGFCELEGQFGEDEVGGLDIWLENGADLGG